MIKSVHLFLFSFSIILASIGATVYYSLLPEYNSFYSEENGHKLIELFKTHYKPRFALQKEKLISMRAHPTLIDPYSFLKHDRSIDDKLLEMLLKFEQHCNESQVNSFLLDKKLSKYLEWIRFKCKINQNLEDIFFTKEPYLTPFGESFVVWALESNFKKNIPTEWVANHLKYTHVLELSLLKKYLPHINKINPFDALLETLEPAELQNLLKEERRTLTSQYLIDYSYQNSNYQFFSKSDWDSFIMYKGIKLVHSAEGLCQGIEGNSCWTLDQKNLDLLLKIALGFIVTSLFILSSLSIKLFFNWRKYKKEIQESQLLIMHTLTHELRTPVTSLQLSMETFRSQFNNLSEDAQAEFLRMADELQRLNRVIFASKNYLRSNTKESKLSFDLSEIPSLNDYLESTLEPYIDKIHFNPLVQDSSCYLDPYWLGMCLTNLVRNALAHGTPPITFYVKANKNNTFMFTVEDSGQSEIKL